jgi:eukaryotic-like serine/threonine-protein kinase
MARQTIAGRYDVERPIGHGGMGTVWLCRDRRLGRHVAVKQIGTLPGETAPDLARAMREARSSAALNHPNVVSIYDVVEEEGDIWLVMEYVASRTLAQILVEEGPLSPECAAWIGTQIADGLAAAHAAGTIHRDVKPGNILVTEAKVAKISDFGIARVHGESQLTRVGLVVGTPAYFSPELARGEDPTPAADVWALGATLYAAVEGHPLYPDQRNDVTLLRTIASSPPPEPQQAGFLTEPIGRMLDPDPGARCSMMDAAHELRRFHELRPRPLPRESMDGSPGSQASPGADAAYIASRDDDRPRRGISLVLAALSAALALAAVGGVVLLRDGPADQPSASTRGTHSTSGPAQHSNAGARQTRSPEVRTAEPTRTASTSVSTHPATGAPAGPPSQSGHSAPTASAEQFVRDYYAALPSNTRSSWSELSRSFREQIGGYDSYRGFWSTISKVTVGDTTPGGADAVDVDLTYATTDGRVESEVRRIFLEREGTGYLIDDDAIVG